MSAEIIPFPQPNELTPEQRDYFHQQAAYYDEVEQVAQRTVEYAQKQREHALRMLGMLAMRPNLDPSA